MTDVETEYQQPKVRVCLRSTAGSGMARTGVASSLSLEAERVMIIAWTIMIACALCSSQDNDL